MRQHQKFSPVLFTPSFALITPFPVIAFLNIPAANVSNCIGRNPLFCYFASFLIGSLVPYINNLNSSSDLTIFVISSISSFQIINAAVREAKHQGRPVHSFEKLHLLLTFLLIILMESKHF